MQSLRMLRGKLQGKNRAELMQAVLPSVSQKKNTKLSAVTKLSLRSKPSAKIKPSLRLKLRRSLLSRQHSSSWQTLGCLQRG